MSVFSEMRTMEGRWTVVDERPLNEEELAQVLYVKSIPSQYGRSAEFYCLDESEEIKTWYIPLSRDCQEFTILNAIKIKEHVTLITLRRGFREDWVNEKEEDAEYIYRINVKL